MSAIRQRAAQMARRARPSTLRQARSYASESHGSSHGHHSAPVEESLGTGFYVAVGSVPAAMLVYSISQPGKDGEPAAFTKMIEKWSDLSETWEQRNTMRTKAYEQAAHDKHLFYNPPKNSHIELNYPEIFQHGSPRNVPAGSSVNLDKVVAHYQEQHLKEEDRKARKLAAAAASAKEE